MTTVAALQAVTQGVFVLIFGLTLSDLVRYRDRAHLEIAGLFGTLALIILLQGVAQITGVVLPPYAKLIAAAVIVAQPYMLLRLVTHFRSLPRTQHAIALVCLFGSWAVLIWTAAAPSVALTTAIVVPFAYVEGYATFAFVRAAIVTRGVTQRRLIAIALGSGLLASVILLAGVTAFLPAAGSAISTISNLLALGSAVAYYVGFAPPRWLRVSWQMAEFRRFLLTLSGRTSEDHATAALDHLGLAATRAAGGKAAVIAIGEEGADTLTIRTDPANRAALAASQMTTIELGSANPMITSAWRQRRPLAADAKDWGPTLRAIGSAFGGASSALLCPIAAHEVFYGLLIVLSDRRSPFVADELELLPIFAEQAALAIEGGQSYLAAQRNADERQALLRLSQTLSEETEAALMAERMAEQLQRLVPTTSWAFWLKGRDDGLELVAAHGTVRAHQQRLRAAPGSGITGRVLRSGIPALIDDVRADPDYQGPDPSVRSLLVVPLRHRQEISGVLVLGSSDVGAFKPEHQALAEIVAADAAVALARAQLVERLTESETRHRMIVDGALDAVVTMDATGAITDWNPQAETMFGWSRQEALGRKVEATIMPARYTAAHSRGIERYLSTGEATVLNQRLELSAINRAGHEFPVDLAITAVQRDASPSFTAFIRDISVRKQAEQQLQGTLAKLESQNLELEQASRMKSDFLANMSHELRTPLNAIIGFSDVLLEELFGELNDKQREYTQDVLTSGHHLLALINDILDLSKIESGKMDMDMRDFSVLEVLESGLKMIRQRAAEHAIQLEFDIAPGTDVIQGDQRKVKQILFNLLSNAIKFTPDGGSVRITTRQIEGGVEITVSDTGIGIAPEDQEKVFDEFQQVGASARQEREGTGLGLALVKQLVELHGGRVWLESEVGQGSTFTFTLPQAAVPAGSAS
ncbi:MAG TPA: ATP-binding protein [Chloroflexota bacterium]|nr:ATP-binding protein [Chloroflexota bacterium]